MFLPDLNTMVAPLTFSSQVDLTVLSSNLLGHHGEILPGFQFPSPPKRGRPKGSKTKKRAGRRRQGGLEISAAKLVPGQNKEEKHADKCGSN